MTESERGRFCQQCEKQVIDFTQLSDSEIQRIFQNHSGKCCGRFNHDQLNRALALPAKKSNWVSHVSALFAGISLLTFSRSAATTGPLKAGMYASPGALRSETTTSSITDTSDIVLRGRVIDSATQKGLPYASVWLDGTNAGFMTDSNGYYNLRVPGELNGKKLTIEVALVGCSRKEIIVDTRKGLQVNDVVLSSSKEVLGEIVITLPKKKKHWWQFWK